MWWRSSPLKQVHWPLLAGCLRYFLHGMLSSNKCTQISPKLDADVTHLFLDRFLLKTQVPAGAPEFHRRLWAVRESDPWAFSLCLTRRWQCVSQKWCRDIFWSSLTISGSLHCSTIILLFAWMVGFKRSFLRESCKMFMDEIAYMHPHSESLPISAPHPKSNGSALVSASWLYIRLS